MLSNACLSRSRVENILARAICGVKIKFLMPKALTGQTLLFTPVNAAYSLDFALCLTQDSEFHQAC